MALPSCPYPLNSSSEESHPRGDAGHGMPPLESDIVLVEEEEKRRGHPIHSEPSGNIGLNNTIHGARASQGYNFKYAKSTHLSHQRS